MVQENVLLHRGRPTSRRRERGSSGSNRRCSGTGGCAGRIVRMQAELMPAHVHVCAFPACCLQKLAISHCMHTHEALLAPLMRTT